MFLYFSMHCFHCQHCILVNGTLSSSTTLNSSTMKWRLLKYWQSASNMCFQSLDLLNKQIDKRKKYPSNTWFDPQATWFLVKRHTQSPPRRDRYFSFIYLHIIIIINCFTVQQNGWGTEDFWSTDGLPATSTYSL